MLATVARIRIVWNRTVGRKMEERTGERVKSWEEHRTVDLIGTVEREDTLHRRVRRTTERV